MKYLLTEITYIGPNPADHPEYIELTIAEYPGEFVADYELYAGSYGDYATTELGIYATRAEALDALSTRCPEGYRPVTDFPGGRLGVCTMGDGVVVTHSYYPGPAERWSDAVIADYIHNGYNDLIASVKTDTPDDDLIALATQDAKILSEQNATPVDCHAQIVGLYFQHRDDLREDARNDD